MSDEQGSKVDSGINRKRTFLVIIILSVISVIVFAVIIDQIFYNSSEDANIERIELSNLCYVDLTYNEEKVIMVDMDCDKTVEISEINNALISLKAIMMEKDYEFRQGYTAEQLKEIFTYEENKDDTV